MKRIAVLGAKGMLGQAVTSIAGRENIFDVKGFDVVDADITVPESVIKMYDEFSPDAVINCAAFTDVDGCEAQREMAIKVNAEGVGNVASEAAKRNALVIHISTDYIFNGTSHIPYKEGDIPSPQNYYGKSKLEGEKLLRERTDNHLILRTEWLYGQGGKNFVFAMLEKQKKGETINVVDDQIGSPTLTDEVVRAIISLLKKECRGIYNFTSSGKCSWYEFAKRIFEISGLKADLHPVKSVEFNLPAVRPKYSVLDCSKIERDAGLAIKRWDESLTEFLYSLDLH